MRQIVIGELGVHALVAIVGGTSAAKQSHYGGAFTQNLGGLSLVKVSATNAAGTASQTLTITVYR